MKRTTLVTAAALVAAAWAPLPAQGHDHDHPTLHINTRWKECSFQLSPSLTQSSFRQFSEEAALVVYFRPLSDARPLGRRNYEISILQWDTNINDHNDAWNDTFVHPDSTHWLLEDGKGLQFPGLMARAGITDRMDVAAYVTKAPGANYGFFGGQIQRSLLGATSAWSVATRASFMSMYGPEDVSYAVYGADMVASRRFTVSRRAAISPYAGVSAHIGHARERSAVVDLENEATFGTQAMAGAAVELSKARLGVEYNAAQRRTISLKVGVGL